MDNVALQDVLQSAFSEDKNTFYFNQLSQLDLKSWTRANVYFSDETGLELNNLRAAFVNYVPSVLHVQTFQGKLEVFIQTKDVAVVLPEYQTNHEDVRYYLNEKFGHVNFFDTSKTRAAIPHHIIHCETLDFENIAVSTFDKTKILFWRKNPQNSICFNDVSQHVFFHLGEKNAELETEFLSKLDRHVASVGPAEELSSSTNLTLPSLHEPENYQYLLIDTQKGKGFDWVDEAGNSVEGKVFDNFSDLKNVKLAPTDNKLQIDNRNCTEFLTIWVRQKVLTPNSLNMHKDWFVAKSFAYWDK